MNKDTKNWKIAFILLTVFLIYIIGLSPTNYDKRQVQYPNSIPVQVSAAFSNLYESSDPLELGHSVIIRVDVSDPQGWKDVYIEYDGANYSMINIPSTDTWEYNWTPTSYGIHPYTIYSRFNANKWNTLSNSITVVNDATPPSYTLIEKPRTGIRIGDKVKLVVEVKDSHGIRQVYIIFDTENYSMENVLGTDLWEYEFTAPNNQGTYTYTIYMEDNNNNLNFYTDTIEVTNGSSETPEGNNLLWIPLIIGAFGGVIGMMAVKSKRSSHHKTEVTREITKKKNKIDPNIERASVSITCPICKIKLKVLVPKTVINGSKQLTTLSIPGNKGCDHHYQAFIDKNFIVRGYQKVDYEFDPEELEDIEIIKENSNSNNNHK